MSNTTPPEPAQSPGARHHQPSALPSKPCAACARPMRWRRRWANTWHEVKYCSDACRRTKGRRV